MSYKMKASLPFQALQQSQYVQSQVILHSSSQGNGVSTLPKPKLPITAPAGPPFWAHAFLAALSAACSLSHPCSPSNCSSYVWTGA